MAGILPPDPDLIPEELTAPCTAEWLRALADLGRMPLGDTGDTDPVEPAAKPEGCGGSRTGVFLLPLLWLARGRRH